MYLTDEGIDLLRCAIVKQAADDYDYAVNPKPRKRWKTVNKKKVPVPQEEIRAELNQRARELEEFFHSSWYGMLVDIGGDAIIKEIKERYGK